MISVVADTFDKLPKLKSTQEGIKAYVKSTGFVYIYDGDTWSKDLYQIIETAFEHAVEIGMAYHSQHKIANLTSSITQYTQFKTPVEGDIVMSTRSVGVFNLTDNKPCRVEIKLYEGSSSELGTTIPINNMNAQSINLSGCTNINLLTTAPASLGTDINNGQTISSASGDGRSATSDKKYIMKRNTVYTLSIRNERTDSDVKVDLDWFFHKITN